MPSALKIRGEEGICDLAGKPGAYDPAAQTEHIGIVVKPCVLCHVAVGAQCCAYAVYLVGCDGYANACAAASVPPYMDAYTISTPFSSGVYVDQ